MTSELCARPHVVWLSSAFDWRWLVNRDTHPMCCKRITVSYIVTCSHALGPSSCSAQSHLSYIMPQPVKDPNNSEKPNTHSEHT